MKQRSSIILALVSSLAILGVGLNGLLLHSNSSLFVSYVFTICGGIGVIASVVRLFKQRTR